MLSSQAIGRYFETDSEGYLINPANKNHIPTKWQPVIQHIKKAYLSFYHSDLHSLYLRGSMVRGTFREGISDLDLIALVYQNGLKWVSAPFEAKLEQQLQIQFPFVKDLELKVSSFSIDFEATYPALAMVLKTQALCIFGKDLSASIKPFKVGKALLFHHKWLEEDISVFLKKESFEKSDTQAIMKMIIRSGFELVIEKERKFTLDLYPAVQSFANHYPNKRPMMEMALFYYLNPNESPQKQQKLVVTFGIWLVKEINSLLK